MNRLMHSLATLWVYIHREDYARSLRNEYVELLEQQENTSNPIEQLRLQQRIAIVAEEIHALALPFRMRSFWAPLPSLSEHAMEMAPVTVVPNSDLERRPSRNAKAA